MPQLSDHQSSSVTKMLFIGDSGCLTGDTIVSMKRGGKPRKISLAELFQRHNGKHHNKKNHDTFLLADLGGFAGLAQMSEIVRTGAKSVFQVETFESSIKATADHLFKTGEGWLPLSELKVGMSLLTWRSSRTKVVHRRGVGRNVNQGRVWIYSIPYHPYGIANVVGGRDYKRAAQARLVVEAAMNGLTLDEFVQILRKEAKIAAELQYLSTDVDVHHLDGNFTNDKLENLQVIDRAQHIAEHQDEKVKESKSLEYQTITAITARGEMPTFDIKMFAPYHNFIADGFVVHNSGKTGALASLAQAGYRLRILDLDSGLDVLSNLLRDPKSPYGPEALKNVTYETITDPMKVVAGKLVPSRATVWQRAIELLQHWRVPKPRVKGPDGKELPIEYAYDLGPLVTWGEKDILVIDSLTMLSNAALNFVLSMNTRLGQQPHQSDWYTGQQMIESLLQMLYDENVRCNVILVSHISYIGEENGPQHGYPASLGKALSPKIGRYFNTCVMAKSSGSGTAVKRKIITNSTQMVELKTSAPLKMLPEYPLETGLSDIFKVLRGG